MERLDILICSVYAVGLLIAIFGSVFTEYLYNKAKKEEKLRSVGQPSFLSITRTLHFSTQLFGFLYLMLPFLTWFALSNPLN